MVTVMSVFTPALLRSFQPEVHYSVLRDNYGAAGGVVYRFHCMYITITHLPFVLMAQENKCVRLCSVVAVIPVKQVISRKLTF